MKKRTLNEIIEILQKHKRELKEKFNITEIGVFGSFSRCEENEKSDIDLIVEFDEIPTYFKLIELEDYLSKLLKRKVDLLTPESLSSYVRPYVEKEVKYA